MILSFEWQGFFSIEKHYPYSIIKPFVSYSDLPQQNHPKDTELRSIFARANFSSKNLRIADQKFLTVEYAQIMLK